MKRIAYVACAIGALSLLGYAVASRQIHVKIGVVGPMSGALAEYGKDMAHGAEIAIDELNKESFRIDGKRVRFELEVQDDKASPEEGKVAASRLINAGVAGVIGHYNSGVSIAAAPLYANAGIPQLAVSTNSKYTRMGLKTTYRLIADDERVAARLGQLIGRELKAKSVYMVDDQTTFGRGLVAEVAKALNVEKMEPLHESIDPETADYAALARKINEAKSEIVFFGGDERMGFPLLKAIRNTDSGATFVTGDAMCDDSTIKNAAGAADSRYFCALAGVPPSWLSSGIDFIEMYKAKFGKPGSNSALAFDGVHILAQAMQRSRSIDPSIFLAELGEGSFDGKAQGVVEFDRKGDIKDSLVILYQAIGGKLLERR